MLIKSKDYNSGDLEVERKFKQAESDYYELVRLLGISGGSSYSAIIAYSNTCKDIIDKHDGIISYKTMVKLVNKIEIVDLIIEALGEDKYDFRGKNKKE